MLAEIGMTHIPACAARHAVHDLAQLLGIGGVHVLHAQGNAAGLGVFVKGGQQRHRAVNQRVLFGVALGVDDGVFRADIGRGVDGAVGHLIAEGQALLVVHLIVIKGQVGVGNGQAVAADGGQHGIQILLPVAVQDGLVLFRLVIDGGGKVYVHCLKTHAAKEIHGLGHGHAQIVGTGAVKTGIGGNQHQMPPSV